MSLNLDTKRNLVAFLFFVIALIFHSASSVLVNYRIPDTFPLPDVGLDLLPYEPVILTYCEVFTTLQLIVFFGILFFRIDRMIILRRFFIIYGLLLFLRPLFFLSTNVSHSHEEAVCDYELDFSQDSYLGVIGKILVKAFDKIMNYRMISSLDPKKACFEHVLSMQTILTLLVYNFILKYVFGDSDVPNRPDGDSLFILTAKWFYWFVNTIVSCGGLFAQFNYSMDVVLAFYITNQVFAMYHTMAFPGIDYRDRPQTDPLDDHSNEMNNFWWWPLFEYIELDTHS